MSKETAATMRQHGARSRPRDVAANTFQAERNPTSVVHDLVRAGRVSSGDGAMLLQMRDELLARRKRMYWRRHPGAGVLVALGTFVLAMLGVKRQQA